VSGFWVSLAVLLLARMGYGAMPAVASGQVLRLDAGAADGPVMPGWEPISPADRWKVDARGGWVTDVEAVTRPFPDDLARDFVTGKGDAPLTLRVAVADGPVSIAVLLGDLIATPGKETMPRCYQDSVVLQVGTSTVRSHLAPWDPFRLLERPYRRGRSFWETYIGPRYEWLTSTTTTSGGSVDVTLSGGAPVCAVLIAAGGDMATLAKAVRQAEGQRRSSFERVGWQPTVRQREFDGATQPPAEERLQVRVLHPEVPLKPWTGESWGTSTAGQTLDVAVTPGEWKVFTVAAYSGVDRDLTIALPLLRHRQRPEIEWREPLVKWGTAWLQERPVELGTIAQVGHYEVEEGAVLPGDHLRLSAGCTGRWWGRLHAPDDVVPGIYDGKLLIRSLEKDLVDEIPVVVEVYLFHLKRGVAGARVLYYGFHFAPRGDAGGESWREGVYRQLAAEYGLVPAHVNFTPHAVRRRGPTGVDVSWAEIDTEIHLRRRLGALPCDGRLSFDLLNLAGSFGSVWDQRPGGGRESRVAFSQGTDDWERLQGLIRSTVRFGQGHGWPEVFFEMGGELHNYRHDGSGLRWGLKAYGLIHEAGGKTLLRANGEDDLKVVDGGSVDVAMVNLRLLRRQHFARIRAAGAELGLYNFGRQRFDWGWYARRAGVVRLGHEGFARFSGEPFNDWDGMIREWGMALPVPGGFAPRPEMEWIREGLDDADYIATLEALVAELGENPTPQVVAACRDARAVLERWYGRIELDVADSASHLPWLPDGDPGRSPWPVHQAQGWTVEDLYQARREVAQAIVMLRGVADGAGVRAREGKGTQ